MHCPSCGNESSLEQNFCRKCGFNLEPVSQLVVAGAGKETKLERLENDRAILRRMYRWMMWGLLILLIGVVLVVSGKAFDLPKFLGPLSSFLMVGGAAAAGYGVLGALRDGLGASKKLPSATETRSELSRSQTSELPESKMPVALPSVTEGTTQLIGDKGDRRS